MKVSFVCMMTRVFAYLIVGGLSPFAYAKATATLSTNRLDFGVQPIDSSFESKTKTLELRNTGDETLEIVNFLAAGTNEVGHDNGFSILPSAQSYFGKQLAPGERLTIEVHFKPKNEGAVAGHILISLKGTNSYVSLDTIFLRGAGTPAHLALDQVQVNFPTGVSSKKVVKVTNLGSEEAKDFTIHVGDPTSADPDASYFHLTQTIDRKTLQPGESLQVEFEFVPGTTQQDYTTLAYFMFSQPQGHDHTIGIPLASYQKWTENLTFVSAEQRLIPTSGGCTVAPSSSLGSFGLELAFVFVMLGSLSLGVSKRRLS